MGVKYVDPDQMSFSAVFDCAFNKLFILTAKIFICIKCIMKTHLYNFDPLKPHFYIVKLGFTGVYIIFLILLKT